jgi:hypothetical protein
MTILKPEINSSAVLFLIFFFTLLILSPNSLLANESAEID